MKSPAVLEVRNVLQPKPPDLQGPTAAVFRDEMLPSRATLILPPLRNGLQHPSHTAPTRPEHQFNGHAERFHPQ